MNWLGKVFLLIAPFSFIMGTWWGLRKIENQIKNQNRSKTQLKLLYRKGTIPPETLSDFTLKSGLQILGYPVDSDEALFAEIVGHPDKYDLIQIFSYMANKQIGLKGFAKLKPQLLADISKASADLSNLSIDPEFEYLLPVTWGINGYLWNTEIAGPPPRNLHEAFDNQLLKGKIFVLPQETELFSLMQKTGFLSPDTIDQERSDGLESTVHQFLAQYRVASQSIQQLWTTGQGLLIQLPNGPAAEILSVAKTDKTDKAVFWIPEDKSNLWVSYIGISDSTQKYSEAHEFLSYLLQDNAIQLFVRFNGQATAITPFQDGQLKAMQLPSYLRQVSLSRIEIPSEAPSLNSSWQRTLHRVAPEYFAKYRRGEESNEPNMEEQENHSEKELDQNAVLEIEDTTEESP
ncbi:MAG: ABC transporter substrate-binding protein [Bdellovibrionales bacterium]|nr:ABC transporter substrate-binding protein [Bdellovibrionales bacterium]